MNEVYVKTEVPSRVNGTEDATRTPVDNANFIASLVMLNGFAKHRPLSTIEYEQQLDYLCQWMEKWNDQVVRQVNFNLRRCHYL